MPCLSHTRTRQTTRFEIRHVYGRKGLFALSFIFFFAAFGLSFMIEQFSVCRQKEEEQYSVWRSTFQGDL